MIPFRSDNGIFFLQNLLSEVQVSVHNLILKEMLLIFSELILIFL